MTGRITRLSVVVIGVWLAGTVIAVRAQGQEVSKPGQGVTLPKPIHEEKPQYTKEAMAAGIQGSVLLNVVVQKDGTVGQVDIARSLDKVYGLDESAIKAAKGWRFEPGKKDGKPVAVLVTIELSFYLRKKDEK
jgi:TonB family protein